MTELRPIADVQKVILMAQEQTYCQAQYWTSILDKPLLGVPFPFNFCGTYFQAKQNPIVKHVVMY